MGQTLLWIWVPGAGGGRGVVQVPPSIQGVLIITQRSISEMKQRNQLMVIAINSSGPFLHGGSPVGVIKCHRRCLVDTIGRNNTLVLAPGFNGKAIPACGS